MADAKALKQSAVDYMCPEVGVTATEGAAFGRNYFNRPSAPETEEEEYADERAEILADALALKKSAVQIVHTRYLCYTQVMILCYLYLYPPSQRS